MAINCLAPGYTKIAYTSNAHPHTMVIPVLPDGSGLAMHIKTKAGASIVWSVGVGALVALLAPMFDTTATFSGAEIYTQDDCASAPVFQDSMALAIAGTNGGSAFRFQQYAFSFRSVLGGRGFIKLMESDWQGNDQKVPYAAMEATPKALADYLTGTTSLFYARDNSYLSACLNGVTKVNDELRKRYLNP